MIIKLTWFYTMYRALFEKGESNREARESHPETFLTLHDSLLSAFCVDTAVIFDEKTKATSIWSLINQSKPELATKLEQEIDAKSSSLNAVETLRHQVFAHRFQSKSAADVFAEVWPRLSMMGEIVALSKSTLYQLLAEADLSRMAELETQQLSARTLDIIARDAHLILNASR